MKPEAVFWLGIFALIILFWNGESGMDLHTAIISYLTVK